MFSFLKSKPKIAGQIGYYGLEQWWLSELTDAERIRIAERFNHLGGSPSDLTEDQISYSSQSAIGFLDALSGWFSKTDDRHIAYKIIKKQNL